MPVCLAQHFTAVLRHVHIDIKGKTEDLRLDTPYYDVSTQFAGNHTLRITSANLGLECRLWLHCPTHIHPRPKFGVPSAGMAGSCFAAPSTQYSLPTTTSYHWPTFTSSTCSARSTMLHSNMRAAGSKIIHSYLCARLELGSGSWSWNKASIIINKR